MNGEDREKLLKKRGINERTGEEKMSEKRKKGSSLAFYPSSQQVYECSKKAWKLMEVHWCSPCKERRLVVRTLDTNPSSYNMKTLSLRLFWECFGATTQTLTLSRAVAFILSFSCFRSFYLSFIYIFLHREREREKARNSKVYLRKIKTKGRRRKDRRKIKKKRTKKGRKRRWKRRGRKKTKKKHRRPRRICLHTLIVNDWTNRNEEVRFFDAR